MKKQLFVALISVLTVGCNAQQNKTDKFKELNDSIVEITRWASLKNDTAKLEKALELTDELRNVAETPEQKKLYYLNRGTILGSLGRYDESRECKELYIQCLPEDNPERIHYNECKKMWDKYLTLKDKYVGDIRKDRIVEILVNKNPTGMSQDLAEYEYSSYAVLILEECQSEESVYSFMKKVMENIGLEIINSEDEKELKELSKDIYKATLNI